MNAFWYIDGDTFPKPVGRGVTIYATPLQQERAKLKTWSLGSQSLTAPEERLRDMDAGNIDVQVNFPTLFLETLTEDAQFEAALMSSYNQFMAEACRSAPDRLKWAAVLPLRDPDLAVAELRRVQRAGRRVRRDDRGHARRPGARPGRPRPAVGRARASADALLHSLRLVQRRRAATLQHQLRRARARLHGASADGVLRLPRRRHPRSLSTPQARLPRGGLRVGALPGAAHGPLLLLGEAQPAAGAERPASEYLRNCAIYFTTEAEERYLPHVLEFVGEDRIMLSADMPHGEAREASVEEIQERTDLSEAQKTKILGETAAQFYGV